MANTKTQLTARQRARDASKAAIEREAKRVKVQTAYFESMDAVDKVYAQRDREIAAAEEKAEQAAAKSLAEADKQIRALLALKVPKAEVQERLGCTAGDVRRAIDSDDGAEAGAAGDDDSVSEPAGSEQDAEPGVGDAPAADADGADEGWSRPDEPRSSDVEEDAPAFAEVGSPLAAYASA